MLQRREKENGLIKQIHRPSLLIRLIFQLPGVNYHTYTSLCCSTYIIITVAKTENNLKLKIWGLPPQTSHTHTYVTTQTYINHITTKLPLIFPAWNLLVYSQIPFPPQEPAVFRIDFIYLMTPVLMTLLTLLMVSQTPQHLWNQDWMGAWRVRGRR